MSTKVSPRKMPARKVETFVEERIEEVRSLWRQRELTALSLRFALVIAGYALGIALFDLATQGSGAATVVWSRYLLFGGFLLAAGWTGTQLVLGLQRRLNPKFVARHLEETIPDAKNSVINWLDLRDEPMAPAIRGSLSQQAAASLKQTDPEESVEHAGGWKWGVALAIVAIGLLTLLVWRPTQFGSLMRRAFVPFQGDSLAARVRIELKNPAEGNVVLSDRQGLEVAAEIRGSVPQTNEPGEPTLHFRRQENEAFASLPMLLDNSGLWICRLSRDQVQNGLWYRITAADASTPVYQVKVRPTPLATRFEVTYTPRAYRGEPERNAVFPNEKHVVPRIQDFRGTKVKLVVHTNVPVREGHLEMETNDRQTPPRSVRLTLSQEQPNLLTGEFTLEKSGELRVLFVSKDGDDNADRQPYDVRVLGDDAPFAAITKPGEDISLPANGTLTVAGMARDDVGLHLADLHFKVGAAKLKPRAVAKIGLKDTQLQVDFFEVIPLEQMRDAAGATFPLQKGQVLEYWLEAVDRCDVPAPQVGKSKVYKVNIVEPQSPKDQKDQRQQAQNEKKQHDEQKQNEAKNQKNQGGNDAPKDPQQDKLNDVLDQAQKKKEQQDNRGQSKGDDDKQKNEQAKAEPKSDGNKPGEPQPQGAQNKVKNEGKSPPSQAKEQGKPAPEQGGAGQAKDKGPEQNPEQKPEQKPGTSGNPAQAKDEGKDKADAQDRGQAKPTPDGKGPPPQAPKDNGQAGKDKPTPQAKDAKSDPMKDSGDMGQAKTGPSKEPPQQGDSSGQAKGQKPQPPEEKGNAKAEPAQSGGMKQPDTPQPQQKAGGDPMQQKGNAKDEPGKGGKVVGRAKDDVDPARKATPEEVQQILDMAKEKGRDGERAAKTLAEMAKHSGDEQFKKAMQDFLKDNGREELAKQIKSDSKTVPQEVKGTQQPNDPNKQVTDPPHEELKPMSVTDEFAKKGGNLQLEDLKKLVTPEMLKKSGMTEKDWAQFLADAAKNKDLLPKLQKDRAADLVKGKSVLPGQGIRTIESSGADTGLDRLQVGPPPELRQDYIEFTTPKKK